MSIHVWCLFLGGPRLTAVFLGQPFSIILGIFSTSFLVDSLFPGSEVFIFLDLLSFLVECILHMGRKIGGTLYD